MSKKRPRATPASGGSGALAASKQDPTYWRERLFKCRYTYKGRQFEVRHWSVKIQHLRRRKTFTLHSTEWNQAAEEACELYRALVTRGWDEAVPQRGVKAAPADRSPEGPALPLAGELDADYWAQRLIHRKYPMRPQRAGSQALSVRIDYGGTGCYFLLGTDHHSLAARRALRIYQTIVSQGWEVANKRFSRELTVAFHWLSVPLAWTYTTIHTLNHVSRKSPVETPNGAGDVFKVAIGESDAGIRRALEWSINHMEGFRCVATFANAAEAIREACRRRFDLALFSHSLADKPGTDCLAELKVAAPEVCGLLYSVYEDSETLFWLSPGGAGTYLLKRMLPTRFLEPIVGPLKQGRLTGEGMPSAVWQYFKDSIASLPIGGAPSQSANLTQREHEVLGLLSKGHPDKIIADQLGISIHTVHEHVRKVFDKLGAHNRTEAAVKFLQK